MVRIITDVTEVGQQFPFMKLLKAQIGIFNGKMYYLISPWFLLLEQQIQAEKSGVVGYLCQDIFELMSSYQLLSTNDLP